MIQWKDKFYDDFLTAPSKDTFKKFIQNNLGELDNIDFKETWISKDKLSAADASVSFSWLACLEFSSISSMVMFSKLPAVCPISETSGSSEVEERPKTRKKSGVVP